jgi:hypothetical protein
MRCVACGAEMRLTQAAPDNTMIVAGYEHQTLECSGCHEVERRLVFRRPGGPRPDEPAPALATPAPSAPRAADPAPALATPAVPAPRPVEPASLPVAKPALQGEELDQCATLLERAIEMVRRPADRSSPTRGLADARPQPPAESPAPVPVHLAPPPAAALEPEDQVEECEALLRRAIEMVRDPLAPSQPKTRPPAAKPETPAKLASSMRTKKPVAGRVVQIHHDPQEGKYFARDTGSGLSILRHQDPARLRAMCERIGWRVDEDEAAGTGG